MLAPYQKEDSRIAGDHREGQTESGGPFVSWKMLVSILIARSYKDQTSMEALLDNPVQPPFSALPNP